MKIPLSVLDLVPVSKGKPASHALQQSVDLAVLADRIGYQRFWIAEHHNLCSVAATAPEILIARIAGLTDWIRVGAGGVMLPNHPPLLVAERYKTLQALFGDRIDLGIGRATGTDAVTKQALRRHDQPSDPERDTFAAMLQELIRWQTGFPLDHPFRPLRAMPDDAPLPPLWLLGSGDYSAGVAATLGTGFAFAHHLASKDAAEVIGGYKSRFSALHGTARGFAILAVVAICADTQAEAEEAARGIDHVWLQEARGPTVQLPGADDLADVSYSAEDQALIRSHRRRAFVGTAQDVGERIHAFARTAGADEVMVMSPIQDPQARQRSYVLLAEALQIARLPRTMHYRQHMLRINAVEDGRFILVVTGPNGQRSLIAHAQADGALAEARRRIDEAFSVP